jgi:hypothetical protein
VVHETRFVLQCTYMKFHVELKSLAVMKPLTVLPSQVLSYHYSTIPFKSSVCYSQATYRSLSLSSSCRVFRCNINTSDLRLYTTQHGHYRDLQVRLRLGRVLQQCMRGARSREYPHRFINSSIPSWTDVIKLDFA